MSEDGFTFLLYELQPIGADMDALDKIDKRDLKELLSKNWMTHDAMWFLHTYQQVGIEKANKINLAAIDAMCAFEARRLKRALGFENEQFDTFQSVADFMKQSFDLIRADFMTFSWTAPETNILQWEWEKDSCFAYEGMTRIGVLDRYQCGIIRRMEGWIRSLEVDYRIEPQIEKCIMPEKGACSGQFIFSF